MKSFNSKVAAITGAGSGIGRALAYELAARGCQLALSDVDEAGLAETLSFLNQKYPNLKVKTYIVDVADQQAVTQYAKEVKADFSQVHVIINNAGVALSARLDSVNRDDFDWLFNINFWGVVNGTEAFLPFLKESGDAHIVNISSVFGLISLPKQGTYNAAKFAVRGYTEALRQEMIVHNHKVGVSCVHPGGIATSIARNARMDEQDKANGMADTFDKVVQTTPEQAAKIILKGVQKNKRRILVGPDAHLIHFLVRLLGSRYQVLTQWLCKRLNYI
jgi:short-subunit dehydrogenase